MPQKFDSIAVKMLNVKLKAVKFDIADDRQQCTIVELGIYITYIRRLFFFMRSSHI